MNVPPDVQTKTDIYLVMASIITNLAHQRLCVGSGTESMSSVEL